MDGQLSAAHLGHDLLRVENGVVLELSIASREGLQAATRPQLGPHEPGIPLALLVAQGLQRAQPLSIQARLPQRVVHLGNALLEGLEVLRVARKLVCARCLEQTGRLAGAKSRRGVEHIGEQALLTCGVLFHLAVNELLEDSLIDAEPLAHEPEALALLNRVGVGIVPHGNGVDRRSSRLPRECMKFLPSGVVARQVGRTRHAGIAALHKRRILVVSVVVARSSKERGHRVDLRPRVERAVVEQKCDEQGAAVEVLVLLGKVDAPIPHHRAEIPLESRIALVIAARLILRIILHCAGNRRIRDAGRLIHKRDLGICQLGHIGRHADLETLQARAHSEERHVAHGRALPFGAAQNLQLVIRALHERGTQILQLRGQIGALGVLKQVAEIEMVGVQHRVGCDEVRHHRVAVRLVCLKEFLARTLEHAEKAMLPQHVELGVVEVVPIEVVDVAQVISRSKVDSVRIDGCLNGGNRLEKRRARACLHGLGRTILTSLIASRQKATQSRECAEQPIGLRHCRRKHRAGHAQRRRCGHSRTP